jgi:hypothetical protein
MLQKLAETKLHEFHLIFVDFMNNANGFHRQSLWFFPWIFMKFDTHSGIRFQDHDVGVVDQPMSVVVDEGGEGRSGGNTLRSGLLDTPAARATARQQVKRDGAMGERGSSRSPVELIQGSLARHVTSLHFTLFIRLRLYVRLKPSLRQRDIQSNTSLKLRIRRSVKSSLSNTLRHKSIKNKGTVLTLNKRG